MLYDVELKDKIEEGFLTYAAHVILQRATPDVRDCLKYGARQLLYAQLVEKLTSENPYKKAQKSVSASTARFYVHGDSSAYGSLIRMGKPFALRYPLEDVRGNVGTLIQPDDHAASRYVEMRMAPISSELFKSLQKEVLAANEWRDSYDQLDKFPSVLPSIGFYNIVNGASGIGVSMATSIPQFNLKEVNDAIIKLLDNPNATFEELYCPIDFATGGIIINESEVKESLLKGHGKSAKVRAKINYDVAHHCLVVTEMPYSVYTNTVCSQLIKLIDENPDCGIDRFIDVTGENCCIKIFLTKKANPEKIKTWLYKNTSLQYYYGINMTMLSHGKVPKVFGWKEALEEHLEHSKIMLRNEYKYDLDKAERRLNIIEGYLIALVNIEEIVKVIKASPTSAKALSELMNRFGFNQPQASAILELKLVRLVNLEITKLEKEKSELIKTIEDIKIILNTISLFNAELKSRINAVSKKYGDARRTVNLNIGSADNDDEPTIQQNLVITITKNGLIYPLNIEQFATQNRGGRGIILKHLQNNDYILDTIYCSNSDSIILFSNYGKAYTFKAADLKIGEEIYASGIFDLYADEYITKIVPFNKMNDYQYVVFATKHGMIKKTQIQEYHSKKKGGLLGIKLKDGDKVIGVDFICDASDQILLTTKNGYTVRFNQSQVSETGRATMGVIGCKLSPNDSVIALNCFNEINKPNGLVTITKNGFAKITSLNEFNTSNRATKGVVSHKFKTDNDNITAAAIIYENSREILCVASNSIIRLSENDLQKSGRDTMGTKLMKLKDNQQVSQLVVL